jgi:hypothetical protein
MNVIIDNYTSEKTTEPMYLAECFNRVGIQAALWNRSEVSLFDLYEIIKPNLIIANLSTISLDLFKVLKGKSTDLVVNISGGSQEDVSALESAVKANNISCPLLFSDGINDKYKTSLTHLEIMKGADIFLSSQNIDGIPDYSIDKAFFVDSAQDVTHEDTYHVIGIEHDVPFDMFLPINVNHEICKKYKKIEFIQSKLSLPQHFFDVNFYGSDVSTKTAGSDSDTISSFISQHFGEDVQSSVKSKHSCVSRAARLLQKIKCKDEASKVRNIKVANV